MEYHGPFLAYHNLFFRGFDSTIYSAIFLPETKDPEMV